MITLMFFLLNFKLPSQNIILKTKAALCVWNKGIQNLKLTNFSEGKIIIKKLSSQDSGFEAILLIPMISCLVPNSW